MEWCVAFMPLAGFLLVMSALYFLMPVIDARMSGIRVPALKGQVAPLLALALLLVGGIVATIGVIVSILLFPTIWNLPAYGW